MISLVLLMCCNSVSVSRMSAIARCSPFLAGADSFSLGAHVSERNLIVDTSTSTRYTPKWLTQKSKIKPFEHTGKFITDKVPVDIDAVTCQVASALNRNIPSDVFK